MLHRRITPPPGLYPQSGYPNPTTSTQYLKVATPDVVELEVYDALGRATLLTQFYPNPAETELTIQTNASFEQPQELALIDMLGRTVLNQKLDKPQTTLDITHLLQGMYKIKVGVQVETLVIRR